MNAPRRPKRREPSTSVKLAVALRALGLSEDEINWSHEPALELRVINEAGTDWEPSQHDPQFLFIRKKADHDHLTFKNNGTGRSDLSAIAHVKRVRHQEAGHRARMEAKERGETPPARVTRRIPSRPFAKGHRPLKSRNDLKGRQKP